MEGRRLPISSRCGDKVLQSQRRPDYYYTVVKIKNMQDALSYCSYTSYLKLKSCQNELNMRPRILQQNQKWSKWLKTLCSAGCRIIHIGKKEAAAPPCLLSSHDSVTSLGLAISGCWHKWSLLYQHRSKDRAGTFRDRNATTVRLHYKSLYCFQPLLLTGLVCLVSHIFDGSNYGGTEILHRRGAAAAFKLYLDHLQVV